MLIINLLVACAIFYSRTWYAENSENCAVFNNCAIIPQAYLFSEKIGQPFNTYHAIKEFNVGKA